MTVTKLMIIRPSSVIGDNTGFDGIVLSSSGTLMEFFSAASSINAWLKGC